MKHSHSMMLPPSHVCCVPYTSLEKKEHDFFFWTTNPFFRFYYLKPWISVAPVELLCIMCVLAGESAVTPNSFHFLDDDSEMFKVLEIIL